MQQRNQRSGGPAFGSTHIEIIATLGPATASPDGIRALLSAGATRFRLNLAHADSDWLKRCLAAIRSLVVPGSAHLPVVADLPGRKFRTERLAAPFQLQAGTEVYFGRSAPQTENVVHVPFHDWPEIISPKRGDTILLQDGAMELRIQESGPTGCRARVIRGGMLRDRMGVVFTGAVSSQLMTLAEEKIRICRAQGVHAFLISYCETPADVATVHRSVGSASDSACVLIPKIETAAALQNVDALLAAVDTVCLARGDLGAQIGLSRVPPAEIRLLKAARQAGRGVWIAGQVLPGSLTDSGVNRPELAALYYALCHGARGFILSEETAVNEKAATAIRSMVEIIQQWTDNGSPHCQADPV
ncbi:MAG: hypothetical protein JXQ27_10580 [Acidobacteria bacterium]|nr:hypothetical protein [Acidobacteriota bacterium]